MFFMSLFFFMDVTVSATILNHFVDFVDPNLDCAETGELEILPSQLMD